MKRIGLSQEALKLIACVAMLADHLGALFFPGYTLRIIGRIAFPIYCFLLAEGCRHSRNLKRYGLRLFLGMLLSELPFDYLFFGELTWQHQSVMVTLVIGFVMIVWSRKQGSVLLPFCICFFAAEFLHGDYGGMGIAVIAVFLITNQRPYEKLLQAAALELVFWSMDSVPVSFPGLRIPIQLFGLLAMIPIACYSGEKRTGGKLVQWAFYLFYPVHMILLILIRTL